MAESQTNAETYLARVRERLVPKGFACLDDRTEKTGAPFKLVAHRKKFESACLKSVDTFCIVGELGTWPGDPLHETSGVGPARGSHESGIAVGTKDLLKGQPNRQDERWISEFANQSVVLAAMNKKPVSLLSRLLGGGHFAWCFAVAVAQGLAPETAGAIKSGTIALQERTVCDQEGRILASGTIALMLLACDLRTKELIFGKNRLVGQGLYPAFVGLAQEVFTP